MNNKSIWRRLDWGKGTLLVFFLLLIANLTILNLKVFTDTSEVKPSVSLESTSEVSQATPGAERVEANLCPAACLEVISEATSPGLTQVTPAPRPVSAGPAVKESYIPLGSGLTTSKNYTGLSGVESVIDMANYPNVKSIIFEASMRIPTANGRVYAKLYNVTDKHDVWNSEVYAEGSAGYRAESGEINLASGRKLYRVMIKSTVGYEAILDSARIKILLK